jgi:hypothetical protein
VAFGCSAAWRYWWITRRILIRLRLVRQPANLLRNANFMQCTNPQIPDYWGTSAAASLRDWSGVLQVEDDSPLDDARAVRLHNPQPGFELPFQSCGTFVPDAQPYTFSVYLRSDVKQFSAALTIGWDEKRPISVGNRWQRYDVTYLPAGETKLRYALPVRIWLQQAGNLWIAAPQLETGAQPPPFSLALMDDHPLPILPWPKTDEENAPGRVAPLQATVELSYYMHEETARVFIESSLSDEARLNISAHSLSGVMTTLAAGIPFAPTGRQRIVWILSRFPSANMPWLQRRSPQMALLWHVPKTNWSNSNLLRSKSECIEPIAVWRRMVKRTLCLGLRRQIRPIGRLLILQNMGSIRSLFSSPF